MQANLYRSWLLMNGRRLEQSEQPIREYLAEHPEDPQGHANLAVCLIDLDRYQEAIESAKCAVCLEPENSEFHWVLGRIYKRSRQLDLAESSILEAIQIDSRSPHLYSLIAEVYCIQSSSLKPDDLHKQELLHRAIEAAYSGLKLDPEHCQSLLYLIKALLLLDAKGNLPKASSLCEKLLSIAPEDREAIEIYVHILYYQSNSTPDREELESILTVISDCLRLEPGFDRLKDFARKLLSRYYVSQRPLLIKILEYFKFLLPASYLLLVLTIYAYNAWGWRNYLAIAYAIATCISMLPLLELTRLDFKVIGHPKLRRYLKSDPTFKYLWGIFGFILIFGLVWQSIPSVPKMLFVIWGAMILGYCGLVFLKRFARRIFQN